jgi:hypothetical protein
MASVARIRTFMDRCADIDGAALGDGAFADGPAIWVGTREVAHFDSLDEIEVRLTKRVIRERRTELSNDERVELRPRASDWICVRVRSASDFDRAFGLVQDAVAANRSTATPGLPPSGADLARRRRFH